jgi:hypothetical protein
MGVPGGFAAYTAGTMDGNSRRLCGMYRRGPGRYSDRRSAGRRPSLATHSTSPIKVISRPADVIIITELSNWNFGRVLRI